MLMYVFLLMVYFIVASCCFFIRSEIHNVGCLKPIQKGLDAAQGVKPRLTKDFTEFGYIYSVNTPSINLKSDIVISQSSAQQWLPHEVTGIVAQYALDEASSTFIIHAQISDENADKLRETILLNSPMTIKFGTFAFDRSRYKWYTSLENGTPNGISGTVKRIEVVHLKNSDTIIQHEAVIELASSAHKKEPRHQVIEFFNLKRSSDASVKRIDWSGPRRSGCNKSRLGNTLLTGNWEEIVEKDIVF